jgi:hypothetical protein
VCCGTGPWPGQGQDRPGQGQYTCNLKCVQGGIDRTTPVQQVATYYEPTETHKKACPCCQMFAYRLIRTNVALRLTCQGGQMTVTVLVCCSMQRSSSAQGPLWPQRCLAQPRRPSWASLTATCRHPCAGQIQAHAKHLMVARSNVRMLHSLRSSCLLICMHGLDRTCMWPKASAKSPLHSCVLDNLLHAGHGELESMQR